MMTPVEQAIVGAFLYEGISDYNESLPYHDFFGACGFGVIDGMAEICQYAEYIGRRCEEEFESSEHSFPGVFDYEVTAPFATWWARKTYDDVYHHTPLKPECHAKIEELIDTFMEREPKVAEEPVAAEMPIFIAGEETECCRKCGTRTEWMGMDDDGYSIEHCPKCGFMYLLDLVSDSENADSQAAA